MKDEFEVIDNYGILTSISWNSNDWSKDPTAEDLKKSKYGYVKDKAHMHESLNFGHELLPVEEDGYYIGYSPMLNSANINNSKNVEIVFFTSSNYNESNQKSIVGFYGFPEFGEWYDRTAKHNLYRKYDSGNIKAFPENIIYFDNPVIINNENAEEKKLLPVGKKISQQSFNYLNSDNIYNIIKIAFQQNPQNLKLKNFLRSFPITVELSKEVFELRDYIEIIRDQSANTIEEIMELEKRMKNQKPEIKKRISSYIERGAISIKVKKLTNYKCLVCSAFNIETNSFEKNTGDVYVETHHVEPVSTLQKGILSLSNLITVCANHHRQMHYGKVTLISQTNEQFVYTIDQKTIVIKKLRVH